MLDICVQDHLGNVLPMCCQSAAINNGFIFVIFREFGHISNEITIIAKSSLRIYSKYDEIPEILEILSYEKIKIFIYGSTLATR